MNAQDQGPRASRTGSEADHAHTKGLITGLVIGIIGGGILGGIVGVMISEDRSRGTTITGTVRNDRVLGTGEGGYRPAPEPGVPATGR